MFPLPRFIEHLPHARHGVRLEDTMLDVAPFSRELTFVREETGSDGMGSEV